MTRCDNLNNWSDCSTLILAWLGRPQNSYRVTYIYYPICEISVLETNRCISYLTDQGWRKCRTCYIQPVIQHRRDIKVFRNQFLHTEVDKITSNFKVRHLFICLPLLLYLWMQVHRPYDKDLMHSGRRTYSQMASKEESRGPQV